MKKDHTKNTVGPWAKRKLDALEDYLKFYKTALKKLNFRLVYVDAFSGSCVSRIRQVKTEQKSTLMFGELDDQEAQEQFITGSPLRALAVDPPFDEYYFFDLDESRVETLNEIKKMHPSRKIDVRVGDANRIIVEIANNFRPKNVRGVAFLDPYGAHLKWETLEALASTRNFEVIINFPAAMAINRLITKSGKVPENWSSQLTDCFGTEKWRDIAYNVEVNLFGEEVTTKNGGVSERLLALYIERLEKIFPHVATPHLITNTRKSPLYYLIWAGPNKLGLKGADYILSQGEKVSRKRR